MSEHRKGRAKRAVKRGVLAERMFRGVVGAFEDVGYRPCYVALLVVDESGYSVNCGGPEACIHAAAGDAGVDAMVEAIDDACGAAGVPFAGARVLVDETRPSPSKARGNA